MVTSAAVGRRTSVRRASSGSVSQHHLLRQGSSGAEVKQLQRSLSAAGVKVAVNGKFDAQTERAVREFQRAKNLQVDGVVGQQTWGKFHGKSYPPGVQMLARNSRPGPRGPAGRFKGRPIRSKQAPARKWPRM